MPICPICQTTELEMDEEYMQKHYLPVLHNDDVTVYWCEQCEEAGTLIQLRQLGAMAGQTIHVRVLIADATERWKVGEIGHLLENDFTSKYKYLVKFPGTHGAVVFGRKVNSVREYYFHENEIEVLE